MNKNFITLLTFITMLGMATTTHSMKRIAPDQNPEEPTFKKNAQKLYLCQGCGAKYTTEYNLLLHYKHSCEENSNREILMCIYCNKSDFSSPRTLANHKKICKQNPSRETLNCKYCNKQIPKPYMTGHEKACTKNPQEIKTKQEKINRTKSPGNSLPSFQEFLISCGLHNSETELLYQYEQPLNINTDDHHQNL